MRHLQKLRIRKVGPEIAIIVVGDGFLYKMVRSLVGFLIRVGLGELTPDDASHILYSKLRTTVVSTAPPEGLFLWRVSYR